MQGNSKKSLGGALSVSYPSCGSGSAADGSKKITPLHVLLGFGRKQKEKGMSKKQSDTTGEISPLSVAHDIRLSSQFGVPQCPTGAAHVFGSLGETLLWWQR